VEHGFWDAPIGMEAAKRLDLVVTLAASTPSFLNHEEWNDE
jgi:hypothetical protein